MRRITGPWLTALILITNAGQPGVGGGQIRWRMGRSGEGATVSIRKGLRNPGDSGLGQSTATCAGACSRAPRPAPNRQPSPLRVAQRWEIEKPTAGWTRTQGSQRDSPGEANQPMTSGHVGPGHGGWLAASTDLQGGSRPHQKIRIQKPQLPWGRGVQRGPADAAPALQAGCAGGAAGRQSGRHAQGD